MKTLPQRVGKKRTKQLIQAAQLFSHHAMLETKAYMKDFQTNLLTPSQMNYPTLESISVEISVDTLQALEDGAIDIARPPLEIVDLNDTRMGPRSVDGP